TLVSNSRWQGARSSPRTRAPKHEAGHPFPGVPLRWCVRSVVSVGPVGRAVAVRGPVPGRAVLVGVLVLLDGGDRAVLGGMRGLRERIALAHRVGEQEAAAACGTT